MVDETYTSSNGDTTPPGAQTLTREITRIAYESHFDLAKHYSSIIFQSRIAITTVIVAAVALGFGVLPRANMPEITWLGVPSRAVVCYAAALLINLLHSMEVSYLKRFYQIVRSGRSIERSHGARSYFSTYDRPESWPVHATYLGGVIVLTSIFVLIAWRSDQGRVRSVILITLALLPPIAFAWSNVRLFRYVRQLLLRAD